ncbi:MAG: S8 family serine peptidase [bacterium]|nr:S8 family serine peptidase [bacterium]
MKKTMMFLLVLLMVLPVGGFDGPTDDERKAIQSQRALERIKADRIEARKKRAQQRTAAKKAGTNRNARSTKTSNNIADERRIVLENRIRGRMEDRAELYNRPKVGEMSLAYGQTEKSTPEAAEGRIIVKYKKGRNSRTDRSALRSKYRLQQERHVNLADVHIYKTTHTDKQARAGLLADLKQDSSVLYAEPDYAVRTQSLPNDPYLKDQWSLHNTGQNSGAPGVDVGAEDAWNLHKGSRDVIVAVLDTGIDYTHPDLKSNMWKNPGEIRNDSIDNDGNGYVDDVYGADISYFRGDAKDTSGHGTICAGIIGAENNNSTGISGICPNVRLMAVKVLNSGVGYTSNVIAGIDYAVSKGAHIISISLIGNFESQGLYDAIAAARDAGVLVVTAAGNYHHNLDENPYFPTAYDLDNIISVAGLNNDGTLGFFSSYGPISVDLAAPGNYIYSTYLGNRYAYNTGTSAAAALVAGTAALLKAANPGMTYSQLKTRILTTASKRESLAGKVATSACLDTFAALNSNAAVTVSFSTPAHLTQVSGTTSIEASTSNDAAVQRVEFYVDDVLKSTDTAAPWQLDWNTAEHTDGPCELRVMAYDVNQRPTLERITVLVNNSVLPGIMIANPAPGDFLRGNVDITAEAFYAGGISKVEFYVDGSKIGEDVIAPYAFQWSSRDVANGQHTIEVKAIANDASEGSLQIDVSTANCFLPTSERDALIALYNSTDGDNWRSNGNWKKEDGSFNDPGTEDTWSCIYIENDTVNEICMSNNDLVGTIPPEIGALVNCEYISIYNNSLTGTFPAEFGNLAALKELWINNNYLTGPIPPEFGNLTNLWGFCMSVNQIAGPIPPELGNLTKLEEMYIYSNELTGSIPPELGNLTNLYSIYLCDNRLSGPIPSELGNLTLMWDLDFCSNKLSGEIPTSLTNMADWPWLYLEFNALHTDDPELLDFLEDNATYWEETQTIPPTNITTSVLSTDSIRINWEQIIYFDYYWPPATYEVYYSTTPGGPYTLYKSVDFQQTSMVVSGLQQEIPYYFVIRSRTDAYYDNKNVVESAYSVEVSETIRLTFDLSAASSPTGAALTVTPADTNGESDGTAPFTRTYSIGTTVTLTAPASHDGKEFKGWQIDGEGNRANPLQLTIGGHISATAVYEEPSITVTAPNGGESWPMAGWQRISWTESDCVAKKPKLIEYSIDNGASWEMVVSSCENDGFYDWKIPCTESAQCLVRIQGSDGSPVDTGDAVFTIAPALPLIPESERNALIDLYNGLEGDGWNLNDNWKIDGQFNWPGSEDTWHGITIRDGHVVDIYLYNNNLGGTIPASIGNFPMLEQLRLHNNHIAGTIPATIGNLTNLQLLYLRNNGLEGGIPAEIGNLIKLTQLALSNTPIGGSIPPQLANLVLLERLFLNDAQLSGPIPPELGNLAKLYYLYLQNNQLSGSIPPELGNMTGVRYFYLHNNQLSGSIPTELGNLSIVYYMSLTNNSLSGTVPVGLGNLSKLKYLYLRGNKLSGEPTALKNLNLYSGGLDIGYNCFYAQDPPMLSYLNSRDSDWKNTQTIAPSDVSAGAVTVDSVEVTWTPIPFSSYDGGYRVYYSTAPGGPYTLFDTTPSKYFSSMTVTGLTAGNTYYFVVQTVTDAFGMNPNMLESENSAEVSVELPEILLHLTAPNGGEVLDVGVPCGISWVSDGVSGNVKLEYSVNGAAGPFELIADNLADTGNYNWTVPNTESSDCLLRISEMDGDPVDDTDSVFTIQVPPAVTVVSPNGSEQWEAGSTQTVTWTSNGQVGPVDISYTVDGGTTWIPLAEATANDREFQWTLPGEISLSCMVKIFDAENGHNDTSNAMFAILSPIPAAEREALIALFNATGGSSWFSRINWLQQDGSFNIEGSEGCWQGVTVENNHVTRIQLHKNNLNGTLPAELANLPFLESLILGYNTLIGPFPMAITGHPHAAAPLVHLTRLELENNQLTGPLPAEIGNLTALRILQVAGNLLDGPLPVQLGSLVDLEELLAAGNQFSGTIPMELANLSKCRILSLTGNQLLSPIPVQLYDLPVLKELYLAENLFSGPVPPGITNLAALEILVLSGNQLDGGIPVELTTMSQLTTLSLGANVLTGPIPAELGTMTNLQNLDLSSNRLDGTIPVELGDLLNLISLDLADNVLAGEIPAALGNLEKLKELNLASNTLNGEIPTTLINLVLLRVNELGYNALYTTDGTLRQFLNNKNSMWDNTQTIAPADLSAAVVSADSVQLSWDPILFSGAIGGYRVLVGTAPGGPYTQWATTADKNVSTATVTGLSPATPYYFVVQTLTDIHDHNRNALESQLTGEITTTIPMQVLRLTSANGGETLFRGTTHDITWVSDALSGTVTLEYSLSGVAGPYTQIASGLADTGSYTWTVPEVESDQCILRITDGDASPADTSDSEFSIGYAPSITITAPTASDTWYTGSMYGIRWTSRGFDDAVRLQYSVDGGGYWRSIVYGVTDEGEYSWSVPTWITSPCMIRVSNLPGTVEAISDTFIVHVKLPIVEREALIALYNSTGGDNWTSKLDWKKGDGEFNDPGTEALWEGVVINDNRVTEIHLPENNLTGSLPVQLANIGLLDWLELSGNNLSGSIPPVLGNLGELGILELDNNVLSGSLPAQLGNLRQLITLDLSNNLLSGPIPEEIGGITRVRNLMLQGNNFSGPLPTSLMNLTSLNYNTNFAYNRLTCDDADLEAFLNTKDPDWTTTQTIAPVNGTAEPIGVDAIEVSWTPIEYTADTGGYRVLYSTEAGGPYTLFDTTADKTADSLTVSGLDAAVTYYFVVRTVSDVHAGNKTALESETGAEASGVIPAFFLNLTAPDGGEILLVGSSVDISWVSSVNITDIKLELSSTGPAGPFSTIVESTPNSGSYAWTVPAALSTDCVIRVSDISGTPSDTGAAFTIEPVPAITITSPNGGEQWNTGSMESITWNSEGQVGNVKIEYSLDNGTSWVSHAPAASNTGSISWQLPSTIAVQCLVRITDIDGSPADVSDGTFSIAVPIPLSQRDALIALYNSTNGDTWTSAQNWKDENGSFNAPGTETTWEGITVENNGITKIGLDYNQLSGPIPPQLGDLSQLKELRMGQNALTGSIPVELCSLVNLTHLGLNNNSLTGSIPPEIGNLTALTYLRFDVNDLTGSIPVELANLPNLQSLYIYNNKLSGVIPPELGNLSQLRDLYLSSNQLSGAIPPELGNLSNLRALQVFSNQLTGPIPAALGNLSNLNSLYLNSNQLTGSIPPELGNLTQLYYLYLSTNELTGPIPSELSNLSLLYYIFLSSNELTGSIPPELGNLPRLIGLYLGGNQLDGTIPVELGNLSNLQALTLSSNKLTGSIPAQLGNLTELYYIYIQNNQLTGSIPPSLFQLSNLHYLFLSDNELSGPIPPEVGDASEMISIWLSGNQLSGPIPPELGNLQNLTTLQLGYNQLEGVIPPDLSNAVALTGLYLNDNHLSGGIPAELGNLTGLKNFRIAGNMLEGEIPASMMNLGKLQATNGANLGYNALYTDNQALRDFLYSKDTYGLSRQTTAPTGVTAAGTGTDSCLLSWTPIQFTSYDGGYRVLYATAPGGPYTYYDTTADKNTVSMNVSGLNSGTTYYFVVQTRSDAHLYNTNIVDGGYSAEVSATTHIAPAIFITAPNGGEEWTVAENRTITWTSEGGVGDVKIAYSTDNGGSWLEISASTSNDGAFEWTVPDAVSSQCLLKISETDDSPVDTSDALFSIVPIPAITLTSPNGGREWMVGESRAVTWTSEGAVGDVKIEYSADNGATWMLITAATANDGSFDWTVPDAVSSQCLLRVGEPDGNPVDTSDALFSIVPIPAVTVTSPNGGEEWMVEENYTITWTSIGTVGDLKIQYSTDNGASWVVITATTANDGSFTWTVPDAVSSQCLLRVGEADNSPIDQSDALFSIVPIPAVTVTSPNGGEEWQAGTSQDITWDSIGFDTNVNIEVSSAGFDGTFVPVAMDTANTGAYLWTVPEIDSSQCVVRVSAVSAAASDTGDTFLTIVGSPSICITAPNGGELWTRGTRQYIRWEISNMTGNITIDLYKNGEKETTLAAAVAANGIWGWDISSDLSRGDNYRIRISRGGIDDYSDNDFELLSPGNTRQYVFHGCDFNGDNKDDIAIFRPSNGRWCVRGVASQGWGTNGDIPVPGDYNGNGVTDKAIFRPSNGRWCIMGQPSVAWGTSTDIPVPGDYNGDGKTDIAIFRPSNGRWCIMGQPSVAWGTSTDIPVPGDYNGDGKTDIAIFRPSNGRWCIRGQASQAWGTSTDIPVPADYDGNGTMDIAIFRPANGRWCIKGQPSQVWGTSVDVAVPADYDGNGSADIAIYRPSRGLWAVKGSPSILYGNSTDVPLVSHKGE